MNPKGYIMLCTDMKKQLNTFPKLLQERFQARPAGNLEGTP